MDFSGPNRFDIFEIYRRYCDITSGSAYACGNESYKRDYESQRAKLTRAALADLLKVVESRDCILGELRKLMSQLHLRASSQAEASEFSRFYDFVYFMCREKGQKNISVSRAINAWKLVLSGRFHLLNQWCVYVQKNQRHNISEDTWRQVLAFSRCVHSSLEGYDREGAWPTLLDEFVEYMYSLTGTKDNPNCSCNCGDSETQTCTFEDSLPGSKNSSGMKRRIHVGDELKSSDCYSYYSESNSVSKLKRIKQILVDYPMNWEDDHQPGISLNNNNNNCMDKSPCAIERYLSKGFAGLLTTRSGLKLDRESYT